MAEELGNLPEGWVRTNLGTVIEFKYGKSLAAHSRDGEGYPVYGSNGVVGKHSVPLIRENGLIIGRKGSHGEVNISYCPFYPIDTTYFVDEFFEQPINYWFYQLKYLPLNQLNRSTAIPGLNRDDAYSQLISLPSLAEQIEITKKIDSVLAQVDSIKTRLDQIPQILKRFRQAVLSAAVSGKLTRSSVSERVLQPLGNTGLVIKTGPFGSALHKSDYIMDGVPVINPMHINDGILTASETMTVSDAKYLELETWALKDGDVIVGRRGEMGRAAVVVTNGHKMLCGTGSMILRVPSKAIPKYLELILRSPVAISYFNSESVGSTMVNLNQKVINALKVFYPPLEEQTEIVTRVEKLFAWADNIEKQVAEAQKRVNNLTQSILAKAFRGELTEQWRKENPDLISGENSAAALLDRIKAERAAQTKKPKKKV